MTETEQAQSLQEEASLAWKSITFLLLFTVLSFIVSGLSRFMIGTFLIANLTDTSIYQFICLPASVFMTPVIIFWLPFILVRHAIKSTLQNLIIICISLIGIIFAMMVFLPDWARVLWGIAL